MLSKHFILITALLLNIAFAQIPLTDDELKNVADNLQVLHYDCEQMSESKMYSLNTVGNCDIAPENIKSQKAYVKLFQKINKIKLNATICSLKHHRRIWHCGIHSHSSISYESPSLTYNVILSKEDCENAIRGEYLHNRNRLNFTYDTTVKQTFATRRRDGSSVDCVGKGMNYNDNYETYMANVTLVYNVDTLKVSSILGQPLPCDINSNGCHSTSFDVHAYTWDIPDNCVLALTSAFESRMYKREDDYYIVSDNKSVNSLIKVENPVYNLCNRDNSKLYRTNLDSFYIEVNGGFDTATGMPIPFSVDHDVWFNKFEYEEKIVNISSLNLDYESHLTSKLDYLFYKSNKQLELSELTLLKRQCELERTQILTTLMLAVENTRLAGFILTGNRSNFLETDGYVAWLYNCPEFYSPLYVSDKCFDKIPILYQNEIKFVEPITRQTFSFASEIPCSKNTAKSFQLDIFDEDTWYKLTPAPVAMVKPGMFKPNKYTGTSTIEFTRSENAGLYTENQLRDFWSLIIGGNAHKSLLKKLTSTVINVHGNRADKPFSQAMNHNLNRVYIDSFISPDYFENKFTETFGTISYYMQKCSLIFAMFLFTKFLIDSALNIMKAMNINKIIGKTLSFGEIVLLTTYDIFSLALFTRVFGDDEQEDKLTSQKTTIETIYPQLDKVDHPNDTTYALIQKHHTDVQ